MKMEYRLLCKQFPDLGCSHRTLNFGDKHFDFFPRIGLKLTGVCRLKCPFCCEPNRRQTVYDISNFLEITETLRKLGTELLCFTGGDPLSYPNIEKLLMHTKKLGFYNLLLTGDGALLKEKLNKIIPYLDAVRFSIHDMKMEHDKIVKRPGAFSEMNEALDILIKTNVDCFVTTVVTSLNTNSILDIAKWCFNKKVKKYFLFGLMRSGKGGDFINKFGEAPDEDIYELLAKLKQKYSHQQLEIIHYDYKRNAECILVYGDGQIVIDPYPNPPSFQLEIGNILSDTRENIIERFNKDPENLSGHYEHLKRYYKV